MAEVVGLVAAIIQIAELGLKCSKTLRSFSKSYQNYSSSIDKLQDHVEANSHVLRRLGELLEQSTRLNTKLEEDIEVAVRSCRRVFEQILSLFGSVTSSNLPAVLRKLKFPFLEDQIKDLRRELQECRATLHLMLHIHWQSKIQDPRPAIVELLKNRLQDTSNSRVSSVAEAMSDLLRTLSITDPETSASAQEPAPSDSGAVPSIISSQGSTTSRSLSKASTALSSGSSMTPMSTIVMPSSIPDFPTVASKQRSPDRSLKSPATATRQSKRTMWNARIEKNKMIEFERQPVSAELTDQFVRERVGKLLQTLVDLEPALAKGIKDHAVRINEVLLAIHIYRKGVLYGLGRSKVSAVDLVTEEQPLARLPELDHEQFFERGRPVGISSDAILAPLKPIDVPLTQASIDSNSKIPYIAGPTYNKFDEYGGIHIRERIHKHLKETLPAHGQRRSRPSGHPPIEDEIRVYPIGKRVDDAEEGTVSVPEEVSAPMLSGELASPPIEADNYDPDDIEADLGTDSDSMSTRTASFGAPRSNSVRFHESVYGSVSVESDAEESSRPMTSTSRADHVSRLQQARSLSEPRLPLALRETKGPELSPDSSRRSVEQRRPRSLSTGYLELKAPSYRSGAPRTMLTNATNELQVREHSPSPLGRILAPLGLAVENMADTTPARMSAMRFQQPEYSSEMAWAPRAQARAQAIMGADAVGEQQIEHAVYHARMSPRRTLGAGVAGAAVGGLVTPRKNWMFVKRGKRHEWARHALNATHEKPIEPDEAAASEHHDFVQDDEADSDAFCEKRKRRVPLQDQDEIDYEALAQGLIERLGARWGVSG